MQANPAARNHGSSVLKFSPEGELLMVIGTPGEMGDPPTHLTEPNDVLVAPMAGFISAKRIPPSFRMIPAQIERVELPSGKQMALTLVMG